MPDLCALLSSIQVWMVQIRTLMIEIIQRRNLKLKHIIGCSTRSYFCLQNKDLVIWRLCELAGWVCSTLYSVCWLPSPVTSVPRSWPVHCGIFCIGQSLVTKCYEYVFFQRFHEIVLMYSYNLSITGWVPNLRESSHGRCIRLDILSLPEKGFLLLPLTPVCSPSSWMCLTSPGGRRPY